MGGALCGDEDTLVLDQNGDGFLKLRDKSVNECYWPWGRVNGSTS